MRNKLFRKALLWASLTVIASAVLAGSYFHFMENYELETLDMRFRLRPMVPSSDRIAIVEIGNDTIAGIGSFPFDRSYHAILIKALSEAGAKAIVFDLFFSEPGKSDEEFAKAAAEAGNVYFPYVLKLDAGKAKGIPAASGYVAKNLEALDAAAKGSGHINVVPDIDGKYRRVPAYVEYGGKRHPYVTLKAALDLLGIDEPGVAVYPGRRLDLGGGRSLPLDEDSLILVNFSAPWGKSYRHFSYVDVAQSYVAKMMGKKPRLDLSVFKDKVCFVGLTAAGTVDLHPNPFDTLYPAVGLHAEVLNSILNNRFLERAPRRANLAILFILAAAVSVLVLRTKPLRGLLVLISVVCAYVLAAFAVFDIYGIWIDIAYPVMVVVILHISLTLYKYVREWKARLLIENELSIAKKIQDSFLPKSTPEVAGASFGAVMFTARQVGGDLYDFVTSGAGSPPRFGVMVGDVSGKGVGAALFMAMTVGAFRSFAVPGRKPEEILADLNAKLVRESNTNLFVTMFYAIFDPGRMSVDYANGGHLPMLRISPDGKSEFLDVKDGSPLGLMDGPYSAGQARIAKGDVFIFYTDGITEAMNARSDMYGKERLVAVCEASRHLDTARMVEAIEKDVRKFEPRSRQHDDMTVIVVKIA